MPFLYDPKDTDLNAWEFSGSWSHPQPNTGAESNTSRTSRDGGPVRELLPRLSINLRPPVRGSMLHGLFDGIDLTVHTPRDAPRDAPQLRLRRLASSQAATEAEQTAELHTLMREERRASREERRAQRQAEQAESETVGFHNGLGEDAGVGSAGDLFRDTEQSAGRP